jgi:hypothetical protein
MRGDDEQALRFSRLARELGISSSASDGVEATVALHRRKWEQAKRLLAAQDNLPDGLRPLVGELVDAIADPARRPAVVTALQSLDPKVATQGDLLMPYLLLEQYDLIYRILNQSLDRDPMSWSHGWDIMHAWTTDGAAFRRDPRFAKLAERMDLVDYWKQYGYPDSCRAGAGDVALVCS